MSGPGSWPAQGDVLISDPSPLTGSANVLADRVVWLPVDMLGQPFGRLTSAQRDQVIGQIVTIPRGS